MKSCTSCIQLRFLTLQGKEEEEEEESCMNFVAKVSFRFLVKKNKFETSDGMSQQIQTKVVHVIR
jgi:hypothetical protein